MKRILHLSVCSAILFSGCSTTGALSNWANSESKSQPVDQAMELAANTPALTPAPHTSAAANEQVALGEQQLAIWDEDQNDAHLAAAKIHFDAALREQSNHADAHHGIAIVADLEEDFTTAERHYQMALAQEPDDARILANLGFSYLLQNRFEESESILRKSLLLDPSNARATRNLGDAYARQGKLELARSTYSQIFTSSEIEEKLQANSAPASPGGQDSRPDNKKTLLGKLRPKKEETDATAEILQRMQEARMASQLQREQRSRQPGQQQVSPNAPWHSPESQLRDQLAAIDQEDASSTQGGPVVIDGAGNIQPMMSAPAPMPTQVSGGMPRQLASAPASLSGQLDFSANPSHVRNPPLPFGQGDSSQLPQVIAGRGNAARGAGTETSIVQTGHHVDPLTQPWGGVQTASTHSPGQGHVATVPQLDLPTPVPHDYSAPPPPPTETHSGSPPDAYLEARHAAARIGMSMGSESMFPVFRSTAQQSSPGTSLLWNGNDVPAPHRHLPTDLAPQDLRAAYAPEATHFTPPVNSHGQPMPQVSIQELPQQQFATASRYAAVPAASLTVPAAGFNSQSLQSFDTQRQQVDQQYHGTIEQAAQGRPINRDYGSAGQTTIESPAQYTRIPDQSRLLAPPALGSPAPAPRQQLPTADGRLTGPAVGQPGATYTFVTPPPYDPSRSAIESPETPPADPGRLPTIVPMQR